MSWKIKELRIKGFKFFKDEFLVNCNGKHILLYGENGSGKSSIFWSLYTLFQSCFKEQKEAQKYFIHGHKQNLRNRFCDDKDESSIAVTFVDDTNSSTQSVEISNVKYPFTNPLVRTFMEKSMISSDFMNYKFLQKLFDFPNSKENEVFEMFEKEVFKYLQFSKKMVDIDGVNSNISDAESWWNYIKSVPPTLPRNTGKNSKTINMSSSKYKAYIKLISEFNKEMQNALYWLKVRTESIISGEFDKAIEIKFEYKPASFNGIRPGTHKSHDGEIHPPKIIVIANLTDNGVVDHTPILHPNSFFNEAKLTCAALAMRLAVLETKPISGPDYASVLLIDDLLISLDMSNRKKVVNVILKEQAKRQLMIFTHDRSFFILVDSEIRRRKEYKKWKCLELCIDKDQGMPKSLIMENTDLESKAKIFYHRHEYPACANTLRRAYENVLKRLYPSHLSLAVKNDSPEVVYQNLNGLISNISKFREYYNGFPDIVPNLIHDRQLILNPFSHDDLDTPLFKKELKESINQLEAINNVDKEIIIDSDKVHVATYKMEMTNGTHTSYAEFNFLGVWDKVIYEGTEYYGNPKVKVVSASDNVKVKSIVGLNNLHHAVANAVSLNATTAPKSYNCIKALP